MVSVLDSSAFAILLGTTTNAIEETCGDVLQKYDMRYNIVEKGEFEDILLYVIKAIDSDAFVVSGATRRDDWEKGWQENLDAFIKSGFNLSALSPQYIHKINVKRLFARYVYPLHNDFELSFYNVYRNYLFKKYLTKYDCVFEFGCGTGYSLVIIAQLFPKMNLVGLDWAESSVKLVDKIASTYNFKLKAHKFDYFHPDYDMPVPENSVFLTLNSMEQLGNNYHDFLQFIFKKRPSLCINSEPFLELYNESNLLDYIAIKYHKKRNYLNGYIETLKELQYNKKIEILEMQRVRFGSLFHEGYSFVIWRIL